MIAKTSRKDSTPPGIVISLLLVLSLIQLSSCYGQFDENFKLISEDNSDEIVRSLWNDSSENLQLSMMYTDLGGMGHLNWLILHKVIGTDTLLYRLNYKRVDIFNDTLIVYKNEPTSGVNGWFQKDTVAWYRIEYANNLKFPLDSILAIKTDGLWQGLYKLYDMNLKKVSDLADDFENNGLKDQGIYYIPPPGLYVKYMYNLGEIRGQLSDLGNIDEAPEIFEPFKEY